MPHELPALPYDFDALEPHIDARTMEIHHDRHHAGYVKKLNAALEGHEELTQMSIEDLLSDMSQVPEGIRTAVRNNGGGHANHSLFWSIMSPDGGGKPEGHLADAINSAFGSFETLQEKLNSAAGSQFGSGWGFLVYTNGALDVVARPNQDSPLMDGMTPILGVDVWEHAYYLQYQNKRPDYLSAWWNVINWDVVAQRYNLARA